ncbi:MAG: hypothetical protein A4S09_16765 [Proteobacteria bacterium SG_bin7]|nr:MAG: hypothetical protein A4S09_16765 [Proteobacteria bacterium SG_bin7]
MIYQAFKLSLMSSFIGLSAYSQNPNNKIYEKFLNKCNDPQFIDETQRLFSCENSWDIFSCSGLNVLELGFLSAAASPVAAAYERKVPWSERERFSQEFTQKLNDYRAAHRKAQWNPKATRDAYIEISRLAGQANYGKPDPLFQYDWFDWKTAAEAEAASTKADDLKTPEAQERIKQEIKFREKYINNYRGRMRDMRTMALSVAAALVMEKVGHPLWTWIISHQCVSGINPELVKEYAKIKMGHDNCEVELTDAGELDILLLAEPKRKELFSKNPILCQVLVEKQEERRKQFKLLNPTIGKVNCSKDTLNLPIKIANRTYYYDIQYNAAKWEISSKLGSSDSEPKYDDRRKNVRWTYDPDNRENPLSLPDLTRINPEFVAMGISALGVHSLDSLAKGYSILGDAFRPIVFKGEQYTTSVMNKDSQLGTIAEQTIAIKFGLLEALSKCPLHISETANGANRKSLKEK